MRLVTRGLAACALSLPLMVGAASLASAAPMNNYGIHVNTTPVAYHPADEGKQGAIAGPLGSAEFSKGDADCGFAKFHAGGVFATQWGAGIFDDDSAAGNWSWRCLSRHEHEGHFHHGDEWLWG